MTERPDVPDPLKRFKRGDSLGSLTAATLNMLIDAARKTLHERGIGGAGKPTDDFFPPSVLVRIQNTTGGTLPVRAILTPSGVTFDPATDPFEARRKPTFTASAPVTDSDPVLILFEGVEAGGIGRAVVSGVTVATVSLTDTSHRFARPDPGNITNLVSSDSGPVRLLQSFSSPGSKICYVLLNGGPNFDPTAATDCRGWGWVAGLRDTHCLRAFVVGGDDRGLTEECSECPDAAPEAFSFTMANGTGDYADMNGDWEIVHSEGCIWNVTAGGWNGLLTRVTGGWELLFSKVISGTGRLLLYTATSTNCNEALSFVFDSGNAPSGTPPDAPDLEPLVTSVSLVTADGGDTWDSDGAVIVICGTTYTVGFAKATGCALPCLTVTDAVGTGGTTSGAPDCAGCTYAVFAFPKSALCPTDPAASDPCDDVVRVRVELTLCPGWYCVLDTDEDPAATCDAGPTTVVRVEAGDDTSALTVCSGPYETEIEAGLECSPLPGSSCCSEADPTLGAIRLNQLIVSNGSGSGGGSFAHVWHLTDVPAGNYHITFGGQLQGGGASSVGVSAQPDDCSSSSSLYSSGSVSSGLGVSVCGEFTVPEGSPRVCVQWTCTSGSCGLETAMYWFRVESGDCP